MRVSLPGSIPGGTFTAYDIQGREVYRAAWPGEYLEVSLTGWASGMYFLNVYDAQGRYASGRVVVE